MRNNSSPLGTTGWFQGSTAVFTALSGAPNSYIAANFNNGGETATLSNWLITPPVLLQNGGQLSFWTRTVDAPFFPDRLQVRMSTNGSSSNVGSTATDVGDFTTLLLDINPTYTTTGYPNGWTFFSVMPSGLSSPVKGRLAFRYFVEVGGPAGDNSDYIGIDTVQYVCTIIDATPTPSPTATPPEPPTPSPTPTPTSIPPTPSPTPSPGNGLTVSGTVTGCASPVPVSMLGVTMSLTGSSPGPIFTLTDGLGNYTLSALKPGSTYTVTPTKAAHLPGTAGINTVDVIATQRHFLQIGTPLSGCRLTAADVNGVGGINTIDVIAIQRFFLALPTGIANVGKYEFTPTSTTYTVISSNWSQQNYSAVLFGDVATQFVP